MANTFIDLNDTPSEYTGFGSRFLRVNAAATELVFGQVELNDLADVQANLAYTPSGGQALIYSSAAGKWRPGSLDVYSAGNGLNKNALTLNVTAGTGGGLTANSSGVFITDIVGVAETWGNASHVPVITVNNKGQITGVTPTLITATQAVTITSPFVGNVSGTSGQIIVVGGTGNNSNAVIDLVATGVTAATYGNTTHLPRITVDTYGRIQNVDLIEISGVEAGSGSNAVSLAFGNIIVSGQTTISADQASDDVTFVAGSGITIATQANADRITFSTDASAIASSINLSELNDIDASGIVNGQVLIWNSSTSKFEAGDMSGGSSNVDLSDFSIVTDSPSGNGSLVYNNDGVFTFTPANIQAVTQTLSWNANNYQLSISNGNAVNLSVLAGSVGAESQTLSLSGNVITISGTDSNVDLTPVLANVSVDLTGYATETFVGNAIANIAPSSSYGDSNVLSLLGNSEYATQSYVNSAVANVLNGAPEALDTLAEIANALNNSNATLSTVAFSGDFDDLINRPSLSVVNSTYLVYDDANIDLSGVVGQIGPQGNVGPQGNIGISVTDAIITGANLIITLSDTSTIDAGNVVGPQGDTGPQGDGNAGISTAIVDGSGNLIVTLNDSTTIDAGNVKGDTGPQGNAGVDGTDGVGITNVTLVGGNLVLDYSNTSTQDVGNIQGPKGDTGNVGLSVTNATVDGSGNLIITLSDTSTLDAGNVNGVDGVDGVDGIQLSNLSVTTASPSGNGSLDYNNSTGAFTFTPADLSAYLTSETDNQTLSISGNVITISGSDSTVDLTSALANVSGGSSTFADLTEINTADLDVHDIGRQAATTLVVTANGASAYRFDQYDNTDNPTIYAKAGTTIGFDLTAVSSHPFQIQTTGASAYSTGLIHIAPNGTVSTGVSAQGKTSGTLYWKVPASISGTYEYVCTSHGVMNGDIEIEAAAGAGAGSGIALTDLSGGTGINYDNSTGEIALANTSVSAGTYGSATKSARITVDAQGRITGVSEATISGTGNGGGSGATVERFKLNYTSSGTLAGTANLSAGIASVTIDSTSGGECTITFANGTYFLPPASIMFYGYNYTNNKYEIAPMETSMGYREVPAGGTSGNPTLFNGTNQVVVNLRLREVETGASRGGFGTTTHAWIQFVMYD